MNTLKRIVLTGLVLSFAISCKTDTKSEEYDIVIYGSTPAGITAAIQAHRMGKSAIIVTPDDRLGGASSGGLGHADVGIKQTIGGLSLEFFKTVYKYYEQDSVWKFENKDEYKPGDNHHRKDARGVMWTFEPSAAKKIFEKMVGEHGIEVVYNERIDLKKGVAKEGGSIRSITTESGKTFQGKYFIDASYEGDLMALAGISYAVGRESSKEYNETLAGVLGPTIEFRQPKQFFGKEVSPYDDDGNLLPDIQAGPMGASGDGDDKIQAYNFRICLTNAEENKLPIPKPEGYDPLKYELLYRYITANKISSIKSLLKISPMPNKKTDINDGCPISTDYIGANWDYPDGDYATRELIWKDHRDFTMGYLYFLANDPRLPDKIRNEMLEYGLPKDEYIEHKNWSPQLYIRETRRMVGQYVLRQQDCQQDTTKHNSIGMASYGPDSHHIQRVVYEDGQLINEGNFLERHKAYEIPLGVILPKTEECSNLLVPVCVSSTHIAFGSIRMEPVYMIMGQTAATLACLSLDRSEDIISVPYDVLEKQLRSDGQKLKLNEVLY